jgi:hypothetical protein
MATANGDISSLRIHLNELKSSFDKAMREGGDLANLQRMHMEIKELEWHIKVLDWEMNTDRADNRRSGAYSDGRSFL